MAYETDEARDAARQRLQARMERRETAIAPGEATPSVQSKPPKKAATTTSKPVAKRPSVKSSRQGALALPSVPSISPIASVAAAMLAAVLLIAISLTQCTAIAPADDSVDELFAGQVAAITLDLSNESQAELVNLIGTDEARKLLAAASRNPDALWIAAHADAFESDIEGVQAKLLKLAANEPAAIEYVRAWPSQYPMRKASDDNAIAMNAGSPTPDVPNTSVPHLYQWDRRWGYTTYSSAAFGLTGCGPTALAMVAQTLTDQHGITPFEMGKIADDHGFMTEFNGTGAEFFTEMAGELDLNCDQLYPTGESITEALSNGAIIVANLGPGQFTDNGHFFVLAGLADGKVIINDPYSVERSSQTWDPDTIADESLALFAYTK